MRVSFDQPLYTVDVDALGTLRILEAARQLQQRQPVRVYQASSSEMFGKVREIPQTRDDAVSSPQPVRLREGLQLSIRR